MKKTALLPNIDVNSYSHTRKPIILMNISGFLLLIDQKQSAKSKKANVSFWIW